MNNEIAVIQTGGKQYLVKQGDKIKIEKIKAVKNGDIVFDKVLLVVNGENIRIGTPFVEGAKVEAKVEEEGRAKKVIILKYKPKTRYRVKRGHRQRYIKIKILDIKS
ncbi:MAG: 50S ribosomal protein L21 [Patescibacteria group bacterium]